MSFIPSVAFADCPACGERPALKRKSLFSSKVRLECKCGVAGQWVCDEQYANSWNLAGSGWEVVAGPLDMGPPPRPRR